MKKQILPLLTLCAVLLNVTACSSNNSTQQSADFAANDAEGSLQTSEPVSQSESSSSTLSSSSTEKKAYYDDVFKDFLEENPTTGAPMTYDDVMDVMTSPMNNGLDSYYLVEAIELMKLSDCEKLRGFEDWYYKLNGLEYDGIHYGLNVIYKVKAIKDLITGEDCNKELYVSLSSYDPMYQTAGNPPYAPGEKFTVALFNKTEDSDITQSGAGYFFRFDIDDTGDEMTAHVRKSSSVICACDIIDVSQASTAVVTSTTANPVQYVGEFELSDLVDFLRMDWEERGASHFENV